MAQDHEARAGLHRRTFLAAGVALAGSALAGCASFGAGGSAEIVDAHVHLYDPIAQHHPWLDDVPPIKKRVGTSDYRAAMEGAPIRKIVCIEAAPLVEESLQEARWLRAAAAQDSLIGAIVAQAAVERGANVKEELEALVALGKVTGIRRILGEPFQTDPDFPVRPSVIEGVRALAGFDLVFDLAGISPANLDKAIALARACPNTRFILDHGGRAPIAAGEPQPWARQMRELAAMPHVSLKLSNLLRDAGAGAPVDRIRAFTDVAVEAFGFDRLVFGSDFPVVTLVQGGSIAGSVALMRQLLAQASDSEKRKFFHDNAVRLYRVT